MKKVSVTVLVLWISMMVVAGAMAAEPHALRKEIG